MNILGFMRIFTNEGTSKGKKYYTHSTTLSIKDDNDEWVNYYLNVTFSKGCEVIPQEEGVKMLEIEGFITIEQYTDKKGNTVIKPKIVALQSAEVEQ